MKIPMTLSSQKASSSVNFPESPKLLITNIPSGNIFIFLLAGHEVRHFAHILVLCDQTVTDNCAYIMFHFWLTRSVPWGARDFISTYQIGSYRWEDAGMWCWTTDVYYYLNNFNYRPMRICLCLHSLWREVSLYLHRTPAFIPCSVFYETLRMFPPVSHIHSADVLVWWSWLPNTGTRNP